MTRPLPMPAWAVLLLMFNFQAVMMLEAMELMDMFGAFNLTQIWDWAWLLAAFGLSSTLIILTIVFRNILILIPVFLLDTGDLIYDYLTQSAYFIAQLTLYISFWILPLIVFLVLRSRPAKLI